jgi:WS/DGAT/MGAT family acyltransferase
MAQPQLNRRLTTQDAGFLYFDRPNQPMHGLSIAEYEGDLSLEDVTEAMSERLHLLPRYRQKVVFPPFMVSHPTWEDDPDFDIRNHVVEETLPAPGDDRALAEAAAKYLVPLMDRSRPLWKMVVVRGLADGNTGLFSIAHHAMIDGVSGVDLLLTTHDLTPNAAPPEPPASPWQPAPMLDPLTLLEDAVRDELVEQAQRWTDQTFQQFRPAEAAARTQQITNALMASMPQMLQPAPRTRFNGTVSARRALAWSHLSFPEVRAVRSVLGGTVNDVVLGVIAGAIGRFLGRHGDRTEGMELRAMVPVSMRSAEGRGALGNQVSAMMAPLYVGIADPVERLRAERQAMERLKEQGQAAAFYAMTEQGNQVPAWLAAFAGQFEAPPNTMYNTVSSNMPGPQVALYMKGHKLLRNIGFGMLSSNIGLFNAILSYNQVLTIGVTVDPTQVPDPWVYAECLTESFDELRDAAERVAAESGGPSPSVAADTGARIARTAAGGDGRRSPRRPATARAGRR